MRVPVEIIINGMVDTAAVFSSIAEIQRRNAQVPEKGGIVGSGTQGADSEVRARARFSAFFRRPVLDTRQLVAFPDGHVCFRVPDISRYAVDESLECVRPGHVEVTATVRIRVDVNGGLGPQFIRMGLDPLRRTEQTLFFPIPRAVHDRTCWFPSLPPE